MSNKIISFRKEKQGHFTQKKGRITNTQISSMQA